MAEACKARFLELAWAAYKTFYSVDNILPNLSISHNTFCFAHQPYLILGILSPSFEFQSFKLESIAHITASGLVQSTQSKFPSGPTVK